MAKPVALGDPLEDWPADAPVKVTRRDVRAALRRWQTKMPAHLQNLLEQAPATPEEEDAIEEVD